MTEHFNRVRKFMHLAEQDTPLNLRTPDTDTCLLRARLILEEAFETVEALGVDVRVEVYTRSHSFDLIAARPPDLEAIADGCADLSVVTIGTLIACGIQDDEPLLEAVDTANLEKFEPPICPECGENMQEDHRVGWTCNEHHEHLITLPFSAGPYKRRDGKWVKPPYWQPPNIKEAIGLE